MQSSVNRTPQERECGVRNGVQKASQAPTSAKCVQGSPARLSQSWASPRSPPCQTQTRCPALLGGGRFLQLCPQPGTGNQGRGCGWGWGRSWGLRTRQIPKLSLQCKHPQPCGNSGGLKPGPFVKHIGFQKGILIVTMKTSRSSGEKQGSVRS